jgi:hypothetical protein
LIEILIKKTRITLLLGVKTDEMHALCIVLIFRWSDEAPSFWCAWALLTAHGAMVLSHHICCYCWALDMFFSGPNQRGLRPWERVWCSTAYSGSCDDKENEAVLRWMVDETRELDSCDQGRIQHRGGVGSSPRYRCSDYEAPPKLPLQICTYSSLEREVRDERLWDKPLLTYFLDPPLRAKTAQGYRMVPWFGLVARAWRPDGWIPALYLKEQVEPVHEVIDAHSFGALYFLFQTFEHR